ncbi:MAG: CFI-box-CTERM domain-containing protein [Dehalococcoidia bacterium]
MKKIFSILFALVLVMSLGLVTAAPVVASSTTWYVVEGGAGTRDGSNWDDAFATIQGAINASSDGDTIEVAAGLYKEDIVIDESLTLKGAQAGVDARTRSGPETIIEPDEEEAGISIITTDGRVVVIDGLTVRNGAHGIINSEYVEAGLGVKADITVKNVRVLNPGEFGISLTFTINATVEHCYVENAEIAINAGAVIPTPPTVANFTNNKVVNSRFGITGYLKGSLIEGNLIKDFADGGVGISCQCLNTTFKNNTVTGYVKGTAMTFEKSHHDRPSSENVTVKGNNFTGNRHGIYVFDTQETLTGITVNFNNIAGNSWSGVSNDKDQTLNATRNWWDDASGPLNLKLNRDGTGDTVSDNVDFEPWLGAALVTVDTETKTDDIIDARDQADTEIVVNGTATVTLAQYAGNPGDAPRCFTSLDKYVDVYIPDTTQVNEVVIRLHYTDTEVDDAHIDDEESLRLFSWNGTKWEACSSTGVNTTDITKDNRDYSGYIWAEIRGDTMPTLAQLTGTPFGGYCPRFLEFSIATLELPSGKEKVAYEVELEACMGAEPYTWAITQGSLPDGLGLDADTGIISGKPTRADVFDFTVTVTDAAQITATAELSITIKGDCFIATAAYGTDTARGIDILREFRDEVLLPDRLGASVVSLYYQVSPPVANFVSQHEVLRTAVRVGFVDPIVAILDWSHDLWSARNLQ